MRWTNCCALGLAAPVTNNLLETVFDDMNPVILQQPYSTHHYSKGNERSEWKARRSNPSVPFSFGVPHSLLSQ